MKMFAMKKQICTLFWTASFLLFNQMLFSAEQDIVDQAMQHWEKKGETFSRSKALTNDFFKGSVSFYKNVDKPIDGFKQLENTKGTVPSVEDKGPLPIQKLPDGIIEGDILVVKKNPPVVLVFKGYESFPDSKEKFPFFIYPYRTKMEINTFPPRYHSQLLSTINVNAGDSKRLKLAVDSKRDVSWISIKINNKFHPLFTRGGFRGTEFIIYRSNPATGDE